MATAPHIHEPIPHDLHVVDNHNLALDDLLSFPIPTLERLYAEASVPTLTDIEGDLVGRMLEVCDLPSRLKPLIRRWAGSKRFVWRGKSFRPLAPTVGRGINRVVSDRVKWYPFLTHVGPSRAGDFDAVQLDYDLPENPFFIRAIKDEIRELRPGLFLGQAYLNFETPYLALYFALEQR